MKKNAGSRIPLFSARESKLVKGSADFIGLNFYAVSYIKDSPESLEMELRDFMMDSAVEMKRKFLSRKLITTVFLLIPTNHLCN